MEDENGPLGAYVESFVQAHARDLIEQIAVDVSAHGQVATIRLGERQVSVALFLDHERSVRALSKGLETLLLKE